MKSMFGPILAALSSLFFLRFLCEEIKISHGTWFWSDLKADLAGDSAFRMCQTSDRVSMTRVYLVVCLYGPIAGLEPIWSGTCANLANCALWSVPCMNYSEQV